MPQTQRNLPIRGQIHATDTQDSSVRGQIVPQTERNLPERGQIHANDTVGQKLCSECLNLPGNALRAGHTNKVLTHRDVLVRGRCVRNRYQKRK